MWVGPEEPLGLSALPTRDEEEHKWCPQLPSQLSGKRIKIIRIIVPTIASVPWRKFYQFHVQNQSVNLLVWPVHSLQVAVSARILR